MFSAVVDGAFGVERRRSCGLAFRDFDCRAETAGASDASADHQILKSCVPRSFLMSSLLLVFPVEGASSNVRMISRLLKFLFSHLVLLPSPSMIS